MLSCEEREGGMFVGATDGRTQQGGGWAGGWIGVGGAADGNFFFLRACAAKAAVICAGWLWMVEGGVGWVGVPEGGRGCVPASFRTQGRTFLVLVLRIERDSTGHLHG